MVANT
jgi:hypothetical protein